LPQPDASKSDPQAGPGALTSDVAGLYRTYAAWVTAFLARRFGNEIAEDLAQETFLRLAKHPMDWRSPKSLLARVAINVAQDHLRREQAQKRPRLVSSELEPEGVTLPDQHETLFHREVVAKLPRNLRDVYVLSRFGGMTYAEIAIHLGISVKAVEKRMTQALKLCMARYRA
jgi:RNA polymerase sigma-70 factor (ECF subfamily)